jgi:hypothetical protein
VDVDDVADVSEEYAAFIFRGEVCRFVSFYVYVTLCYKREREKGEVDWGLVPHVGQ